MSEAKNKLIVALDVETFEEARVLIDTLKNDVDIFKVGSQLFTACGPVVIRHLMGNDKKVFLDLKFHDIPNTVGNAVTSAVGLSKSVPDKINENDEKTPTNGSLLMCSIHTMGGEAMLKAAVASAAQQAENIGVTKPMIVGITVLTSDEKTDNIQTVVRQRATLARDCGLDGIVASSQEAPFLREEFGKDFVIVTPGIRPAGAKVNDQKRVTTPKEAIEAGSSYLVVGRPIVKAENPVVAARDILAEISAAI